MNISRKVWTILIVICIAFWWLAWNVFELIMHIIRGIV